MFRSHDSTLYKVVFFQSISTIVKMSAYKDKMDNVVVQYIGNGSLSDIGENNIEFVSYLNKDTTKTGIWNL